MHEDTARYLHVNDTMNKNNISTELYIQCPELSINFSMNRHTLHFFINKPAQHKKNANQRDFYLTAVSWTAALQDLRNQTQKLETS